MVIGRMDRTGRALLALVGAVAVTASTALGCPDVDRSGAVTIDDLLMVFADWGTDGGDRGTDIDRDGRVGIEDLMEVLIAWGPIAEPCGEQVEADVLHISIWYGANQTVGHLGKPQHQCNILGNVYSLHGVALLEYSLNNGPLQALSVGPDHRRLAAKGDFNVELFYDELPLGLNEVRIRAIDALDNVAQTTVVVDHRDDGPWPLPYTIDWSAADTISDAADVVDGQWALRPDGLRCTTPDYDRLVVLGDVTWQDYEMTVPVTVHGIDQTGYEFPSLVPAVGIIFRWTGHTDHFDPTAQPNVGWWPLGSAFQYVYRQSGCGHRLEMYGNPFVLIDEDDACEHEMLLETTYMWKMKVNTVPSGHRYKFKIWPADEPEPVGWILNALEDAGQPGFGSIGLLAHHVDVTFGNVTVTPLD